MTSPAAVAGLRTIIQFEVPWNPPQALSPNSRTSTRRKRALLSESRDIAIVVARQAVVGVERYPGPVAATVTFRWAAGRKEQDIDNLASQCKGILDSLEWVGAIINDRQIKRLSIAQDRDPEGRGCVVIEVTEIEL